MSMIYFPHRPYHAKVMPGRRAKTVDNCFHKAETAPSKELKERLILDAQRLCEQ